MAGLKALASNSTFMRISNTFKSKKSGSYRHNKGHPLRLKGYLFMRINMHNSPKNDEFSS